MTKGELERSLSTGKFSPPLDVKISNNYLQSRIMWITATYIHERPYMQNSL